MRITEKFHSIQGEGPLMGIPMYFVRTNRCNLRCSWCDSTYTFSGGHEEPVDSLILESGSVWEEWICFTGGEPLLQADAPDFISGVVKMGKKVLIETGGSISITPYVSIENTVIDMDIKTPSSGESKSLREENLLLLRKSDYLKFVIKDERDYIYSRGFLQNHPENTNNVFQPCYGTDLRWLAESVIRDSLNVRVMTQLHKHIWGERHGV